MTMPQTRNDFHRRAGWITLVTLATILGSFIFACATPFAALAALSAAFLRRRDAFVLIGINWLANQVIGFGFLHYPQTWDSFSWGAAMGIAALVATMAAIGSESLSRRFGWALALTVTFAASFVAYEAALFAATAVLPAGGGFAPKVVLYVLEVNGLAFAGLLLLQGIGRNFGLAGTRALSSPA
jgi:hypothetical protein